MFPQTIQQLINFSVCLIMQNSLLQNFQELLALESERRKQEMASYIWENVARPNQLPPKGNWKIWLILAGRGFGKTRMGAETIRAWIDEKIYRRIALIAETESEGRRVMIEGSSGLLNIYPPKETPLYEPSKRKITWKNGAVATTFVLMLMSNYAAPNLMRLGLMSSPNLIMTNTSGISLCLP